MNLNETIKFLRVEKAFRDELEVREPGELLYDSDVFLSKEREVYWPGRGMISAKRMTVSNATRLLYEKGVVVIMKRISQEGVTYLLEQNGERRAIYVEKPQNPQRHYAWQDVG